jgi:hypothetical protein
MPTFTRETLPQAIARLAKDVVYVTVGFGVLAVQRAQVQRREMCQQVSDQIDAGKGQVEQISKTVEAQFKSFDERLTAVETRIDALLDQVQDRLPEQAQEIMTQARDAARTMRKQLRSRVGTAESSSAAA